MLRWIDELNGNADSEALAKQIKRSISNLKAVDNDRQTRAQIKKLYARLDDVQFEPDYMCLIIDKKQDYYRACRGFSINGIKYKRLLGTNGGIKNSTIVFVSERLEPELKRRVENNRNPTKELVTAKLEAYKALTCSASVSVSFPNGILIVDDCETEHVSDIVYLSDEAVGEPAMELRKKQLLKVDASDGFGLMLPSLAERWSKELGLNYVMSGCNSRFAWEKGMVYTFDFIDFAEQVANTYIVTDAWGDEVDIRNVELILTTSMVKLWDSYDSCEDYISKSISNKYTFGVPKTCPESLESERSLNYQFIQSFSLSDTDIDELIAPTITEIHDVLGGDWRKSVLFMKGSYLSENNIDSIENDYIKALMINPQLINDPFVRQNIYQSIKYRIKDAKVGVIKVHGNYSIVSGDPYSLCQSIFNLKVTGLLKSGEIYNQYWADANANELICFRAPMTCHSIVRKVVSADNPSIRHWYKYMKTCTVLNSWDDTANSLNGMDFDGDLVMLTDNEVLLKNHKPLPTLICVQRNAAKKISTEEDFIQSNIDSFGNEIGQTTNWITSMFEVQSRYSEDSREYKELDYRIQCGQLFQQNAIDKAKGIICKPMPKEWHDVYSINKLTDEKKKEFYLSIVADKKPYFMRYIYPALNSDYEKYVKKANKNALREFGCTVDELLALPIDELSKEQTEYLYYYKLRLPVGIGDCVMNKICKRFEDEFDGIVKKLDESVDFDYTFLKSGETYTNYELRSMRKLYQEYLQEAQQWAVFVSKNKVDVWDFSALMKLRETDYLNRCRKISPNIHVLCDILLDLCYKSSSGKRFVWKICADEIIKNLLMSNNHMISYPTKCSNGDISYGGQTFIMQTKKVEDEQNI